MYVAEKHIWERISRPLGPHKLAKALMRCLERLQHSDHSQMEGNSEAQQQEAASHSATAVSPSREYSSKSPRRPMSGSGRSPHSPIARTTSEISQIKGAATPVVQDSPSILLVEDKKINLKLLKTFLAKKGYTNVESVADGFQAVQAAVRHAKGFDVIITDVMMPVMDGFEASRKIRELERTRLTNTPRHANPHC
ncbi:hypothetical protein LTR49_027170 [Elasticomyces elasticus]|nr:hypothetical protein LTR49_027170 [Elasticomyces elasticus]